MRKIVEDNTPVTTENTENVETKQAIMCYTCRCEEVCKLKAQYYVLQTAIDDLTVNIDRIVKLKDIPWIIPTVLKCKHYIGPTRW